MTLALNSLYTDFGSWDMLWVAPAGIKSSAATARPSLEARAPWLLLGEPRLSMTMRGVSSPPKRWRWLPGSGGPNSTCTASPASINAFLLISACSREFGWNTMLRGATTSKNAKQIWHASSL